LSREVVLTIEEVAKALRVSRGTAYEAVRRGELPVIKLGRRLLVPRIALDRLLRTRLPDLEGPES